MLNNNSAGNNNRLMQITEQVFDPIRVPIAIGNEVYVMSQQDVRNVVETRLISWEKVYGNNSNCAVQGVFPCGGLVQDFINYILTVGYSPQLRPNFVQPPQAFGGPPNQVVAPIQTQLDWEMKYIQDNPTYRLCNCKQYQLCDCEGTSTTDLRKVNFCISPLHLCSNCKSKGVNTNEDDCSPKPSAYETLKQKKILQSLEFAC